MDSRGVSLWVVWDIVTRFQSEHSHRGGLVGPSVAPSALGSSSLVLDVVHISLYSS